MFRKGRTLSFFFTLVIYCAAQTPRKGSCPNIEVAKDFNETRFAGNWYVYANTYRSQTDKGICWLFKFLTPEGTTWPIDVFFVNKKDKKKYTKSKGITIEQPGAGRSSDGHLDLFVLVDYENFAVVYSCENTADGRKDYVWLLTRKMNPLPYEVLKAYSFLQSHGILYGDMKLSNQLFCPNDWSDAINLDQ